jgi:hypothetical protein
MRACVRMCTHTRVGNLSLKERFAGAYVRSAYAYRKLIISPSRGYNLLRACAQENILYPLVGDIIYYVRVRV